MNLVMRSAGGGAIAPAADNASSVGHLAQSGIAAGARIVVDVVLLLAIVVLSATAAAKIFLLSSSRPILDFPNPVIGFLENRVVLAVAMFMEIGVIALSAWTPRRSPLLSCCAIAWLTTVFSAYRVALAWIAPYAGCNCLGLLGEVLYPGDRGEHLSLLILLVLLGASYMAALICWRYGAKLGICAQRIPEVRALPGGPFSLALALAVTAAASETIAGEQTSPESGFSVAGQIVMVNWPGVPERSSTNTCSFRAEVIGRRWYIEVEDDDHAVDVHQCDGQNVQRLFFDPKHPNWPVPVEMHEDGFPATGLFPDLVWLAFCSGDFLDDGRRVPGLWLPVRSLALAHAFEAKIVRAQRAPSLPTQVSFVLSSDLVRSAHRSPMLAVEGWNSQALRERKPLTARSTRGLPERWEAAQMRSTDWTLCGGLWVPARFEFTLLRPPVAGTSTVVQRILCSASHIASVDHLSEPPLGNRALAVWDRRFRNSRQGIDGIRYTATNALVANEDDPRLVSLFAEKRKKAPYFRSDLIEEATRFLVFAVLVAAPPAAWLVLRWRRARKSETETK